MTLVPPPRVFDLGIQVSALRDPAQSLTRGAVIGDEDRRVARSTWSHFDGYLATRDLFGRVDNLLDAEP